MHNIEPYYNWRHVYVPEEDNKSPFWGRVYSEFEYSQTVYNYYIPFPKKEIFYLLPEHKYAANYKKVQYCALMCIKIP